MDYTNCEWAHSLDRNRPSAKKEEPKEDPEVSAIVGKPIKVNDLRLIQIIARWKKEHPKAENDFTPSNMMQDPDFIKELKTL